MLFAFFCRFAAYLNVSVTSQGKIFNFNNHFDSNLADSRLLSVGNSLRYDEIASHPFLMAEKLKWLNIVNILV